jgi:hypothetical protein
MFTKDLKGELTAIALIPSAAVTADGNGTGVDLLGYTGEVVAVLNCGAATAGTNPTMDISFEDSANDSSFAVLSPALAFTQVTTVASVQTVRIDTRAVRRYIRAVKDIGGTNNPSFPVSVTLVAQKQVQ